MSMAASIARLQPFRRRSLHGASPLAREGWVPGSGVRRGLLVTPKLISRFRRPPCGVGELTARRWYCRPDEALDPKYLEHRRDADQRRMAVNEEGGIPLSELQEGSFEVPTPHVVALANEILALNVLEAAQLSETLSKKLGIPRALGSVLMPSDMPASPQATAPSGEKGDAGGGKPAAEPKAKTIVDVKIAAFPDTAKFKVLKEIRNLKPGMNLMESKALIENLPKIVAKDLPVSEAEEWKTALTAAGATVELE